LLELFRRKFFTNYIFLFIYIFIIRIGSLINPVEQKLESIHPTLYQIVLHTISSPFLQEILAALLVFLQAVLVNRILIRHRLSRESTLLGGWAYAIIIGLLYQNTGLTPILLANTFVIIAVSELISVYKSPNVNVEIFNLGFFVGCAASSYIPYSIYIIYAFLGILILRSFKPLELIQMLIGFAIPYFIIFTYKFWFDMPFGDLNYVKDVFFRLPNDGFNHALITYGATAISLLLALVSIFSYGRVTAKKAVQIQKKIDVVYWLMLFCGISMLVFQTHLFEHLISLAIPTSIIMGISISDGKEKVVAEILHLGLLVITVIGHFQLITV
jgi:hypothetical protein